MIRSAAVLGAGTMGAQIAAHLANAGVPTSLLDLTGDVARQGLERARALKPELQQGRRLFGLAGERIGFGHIQVGIDRGGI